MAVPAALAACGSSGSAPQAAVRSSTSTTAVTTTSSLPPGPTSILAAKIKAAKVGCADYHDNPPDAATAQQQGIRDIANCGFGHLAVFTNGAARDRWVNSQVSQYKMADCAVGTYWAACIFPGASVNKFQIQYALNGVTTT